MSKTLCVQHFRPAMLKSFCIWDFLWELQVPHSIWCCVCLPVLCLFPSFPSQRDTGLTWSFQLKHYLHFYVSFLTFTGGRGLLCAASWAEGCWENGIWGPRRHLVTLQAAIPAQLVRSLEACSSVALSLMNCYAAFSVMRRVGLSPDACKLQW